MKLKDLEKDIELLERSVQQAAAISKEVEQMDSQVELVRQDLIEELNSISTTTTSRK